MGKIWVYPFIREKISVKTLDKFRDWVAKESQDFWHDLHNAHTGDIMVFAWVEKPGEWILVGDAVVKLNEASKEAEKKGFKRRIISVSRRLYEKSVNLKKVTTKKPGQFVILTPEEYLKLLQNTVESNQGS